MKVPTPKRLPSGSWFIQMRINGVSIPITSQSKDECIRQAEKVKVDYRSGTGVIQKVPNDMTLYQAELKYIERYKAALSPTTYRQYVSYSKNRFKNYRNEKLKNIDWQAMIDEELRIVSEKTVKNAWALVSPALKLINYPVPAVKLAQVPVSDVNFLQPEEINPFCDYIKGRPYEIAMLLALHSLRMSEVRALDWKNVDLDNDTITVRGARVRGVDGQVEKRQNKNSTSTRVIPIMIPQLHKALSAVKEKSGRVVFQNDSVLLQDAKRACRKAGVTECTFHDLRRSFASLCYYLQIPEKQIQTWGGWSNTATLQKVYIKLAAASTNESKKAFSSFFSGQ